MTKFLLKCFFTTTVLFLGVLIGIQVASNSMVNMTGDQHYSTKNVVTTERSIQAQTVSFETESNNQLTSHDLEGKQAKLEKIETFNLFSQVGAKLSDGLNIVFSKLLSKITVTIGDILT
ncbi:DUF3679 domain-containing protein [Anaerobacillus alkaliphilus]|uniref:DUF3679 domain-containing protein n=1 Tax=Anaerobacillus alkaliphilus TaxID=1548597 RepID=A0A4Q0VQH3_9BACI|nr:DUF3679 domain-containing protein [Anaerobacillus alkaliphilus]RXI99386.1 DUF3679 domain-containing protein [Anaerobacillus alkaliphilus]